MGGTELNGILKEDVRNWRLHNINEVRKQATYNKGDSTSFKWYIWTTRLGNQRNLWL
jgi:hypothetical protein